jgi:hypothetical protein
MNICSEKPAHSKSAKRYMLHKMRLTIIILLLFFIWDCSDRNLKNNSSDNSYDSVNHSFKDTMFKKDTIVINHQDSLSNFSIKDGDRVIIKKRFYGHLSYTNNFKLVYYEHSRNKETINHYWTILIYDKKMNLLDSVVQPTYLFFSDFVNFDESRSYITGVNKNKAVCDNYYGDFVVADFNFDLKNDFAIINDIGGNGGTFYSYYIQQGDHKFVLDKFLTDSMTYFPTKFIKKDKILVTYAHAGVCWLGEHKYKLDKTNKWAELSYKEIDVCKERE